MKKNLKEKIEKSNFNKVNIDITKYWTPINLKDTLERMKEGKTHGTYYRSEVLKNIIKTVQETTEKVIFENHIVLSYPYYKNVKNENLVKYVNETHSEWIKKLEECELVTMEMRESHWEKYYKKGKFPVKSLEKIHFHVLISKLPENIEKYGKK